MEICINFGRSLRFSTICEQASGLVCVCWCHSITPALSRTHGPTTETGQRNNVREIRTANWIGTHSVVSRSGRLECIWVGKIGHYSNEMPKRIKRAAFNQLTGFYFRIDFVHILNLNNLWFVIDVNARHTHTRLGVSLAAVHLFYFFINSLHKQQIPNSFE